MAEIPYLHARKLAKALSTAVWLAPITAVFFYHPALLPVFIVLPWLAIALRRFFAASFTLADEKDTVRGDLSMLLFLPCFSLALVAWDRTNLLDWTGLVLPTVLGTALMAGAAVWAAPELRAGRAPLVAVLMVFTYPASLAAIADVRFDQAPAQNIVVNVNAKYIQTSRYGFRSYYLDLARWGSDPQADEVEVSKPLYDAVKAGNPVCIRRHSGRLNMAWYEVKLADACHAPGATASR